MTSHRLDTHLSSRLKLAHSMNPGHMSLLAACFPHCHVLVAPV